MSAVKLAALNAQIAKSVCDGNKTGTIGSEGVFTAMRAPIHTIAKRSNRAFTLIELLIVVGIIAILSSVSIPVASKVIDSRRNTAVKEEAAKARQDYAIDSSSQRPTFERIDFDLAISTTRPPGSASSSTRATRSPAGGKSSSAIPREMAI